MSPPRSHDASAPWRIRARHSALAVTVVTAGVVAVAVAVVLALAGVRPDAAPAAVGGPFSALIVVALARFEELFDGSRS